jgi:hypothetical protein
MKNEYFFLNWIEFFCLKFIDIPDIFFLPVPSIHHDLALSLSVVKLYTQKMLTGMFYWKIFVSFFAILQRATRYLHKWVGTKSCLMIECRWLKEKKTFSIFSFAQQIQVFNVNTDAVDVDVVVYSNLISV